MEVCLGIAVKRIPKLPGYRLDGMRLHLSGLRITPIKNKRRHKSAHFLKPAQRIKGDDNRRIGITRSEKSTRHRLAAAYTGDEHLERGVIIERRALTLGTISRWFSKILMEHGRPSYEPKPSLITMSFRISRCAMFERERVFT